MNEPESTKNTEPETKLRTKKAKLVSMISLLLLLGACVWIARTNYQIGGMSLVKDGLVDGGKFLLVKIAPIIVIFSIISGQITVHNKVRPEHMSEKLAGESILRATLAGVTTAGGSTLGPVLQEKWSNGGNKYAIIGCLISISLLNWTTLLFRISFFGEKLTLVVLAAGFVITIVAVAILAVAQRVLQSI